MLLLVETYFCGIVLSNSVFTHFICTPCVLFTYVYSSSSIWLEWWATDVSKCLVSQLEF